MATIFFRPVVAGVVLTLLAAGAFAGWEFVERRARRAYWQDGYPPAPYFVEETGAFDEEIDESSGVATSRLQAGVLWTHNDSGDDPVIYAITLTGRRIGDYRIAGALARDWEDIAIGPCPAGGGVGACLYIADTGDNRRARDTLHVYVVVEPEVDMLAPRNGTLDLLRDIAFVYPDQPHDSEALGVMPNGDLLVVTKGRTGSIDAYRVAVLSQGPNTAEHLATLPIKPRRPIGRRVTGAAVSADGRTAAVRTYTEVYFFDLEPGRSPVMNTRRCFVGGLARIGEAVDFYDESTLVLTSESAAFTPGSIHLIRCK